MLVSEPGASGGLCWSFELDLEGMLAAIGASRAGDPVDPVDQEAAFAAERALVDAGGGRDLTGVIADHLPAGPGLAAWLANAPSEGLADWDLPGIAAAYRRVASWAQAGELAAVAAITSRAAARDDKIGVDENGRPARIAPGAAAEVSLALTMSQYGASWWTHLAVQLQWRLAATGEALAAGTIDLSRARLIAEATAPLDDEAAQAVQAKILPRAGDQTTGQLRAALRRAILTADPHGAEDRRRDAERRAKVSLYPDESGTATLTATNLPVVLAAAAMARIKAFARARKAAGAGGGLDFLCAQVLVGFVLGTLPLIPPGPDGTPDDGPDDEGPDDEGPHGDGPHGPGQPKGGPGSAGPDDGPGSGAPPDGAAPDDEADGGGIGGGGRGGGRRSGNRAPPGGPGSGPPHDRPRREPPQRSAPEPPNPASAAATGSHDPGSGSVPEDPDADLWRDTPAPQDPDAPDDDPGYDGSGPLPETQGYFGDDTSDQISAAAWPPLPATIDQIPPVLGNPVPAWPGSDQAGTGPPHRPADDADHVPRGYRRGREPDTATRRPPSGLLDLTISWSSLAGLTGAPVSLGRIGPVSAGQAAPLVAVAAPDPNTQWRVVLVDAAGHALAVERVRRGSLCDHQDRPMGVVGRVTVTVPASVLGEPQRKSSSVDNGLRAAILRAARRAGKRADQAAAADAGAPGGCAHTAASPSYRPTTRIREYIEARDQTCRQPRCRQPAWRSDLDHTRPWDRGGLTCSCNLGGGCRTHHQIKQQPGWTLTQLRPGYFEWTTPAGRTYTTGPDAYPT